MTKDEVREALSEILKEHIPDDALRWTEIERIYRDVIRKAEDDASDYWKRLLFAKSE